MQIQKGYFYFIKDYYYDKVQDKELMQNKENGVKRPCFYCFKDTRVDGLSWFIPISSKVSKYQAIYDKKIKKQIENKKKPNVDTLVFGKVNNEDRVFLIQNMFPIIGKFISDTYIRNNLPVKISYELQQELETKANKVFALVRKGNKGLVFPDIVNIKKIMIDEKRQEEKFVNYILKINEEVSIEELKKVIFSWTSKEEIKDYIELVYRINQTDLGQALMNIYDTTNAIEELKESIMNYFSKRS